MSPDPYLLIALLPHVPGNDRFPCSIRVLDPPKLVRHFIVESLAHLCEIFSGRRVQCSTSGVTVLIGLILLRNASVMITLG